MRRARIKAMATVPVRRKATQEGSETSKAAEVPIKSEPEEQFKEQSQEQSQEKSQEQSQEKLQERPQEVSQEQPQEQQQNHQNPQNVSSSKPVLQKDAVEEILSTENVSTTLKVPAEPKVPILPEQSQEQSQEEPQEELQEEPHEQPQDQSQEQSQEHPHLQHVIYLKPEPRSDCEESVKIFGGEPKMNDPIEGQKTVTPLGDGKEIKWITF